MSAHKFTDDEIIHSLKVCSNDGDCSECLINPHKGNYGYCTSLAIKAALDLINRQKASLQEVITLNSKLEAENAKLQRLLDFYEETSGNKKARAEAFKEFAERLCEGRVSNDPVVIAAKCLLKEMIEEAEL